MKIKREEKKINFCEIFKSWFLHREQNENHTDADINSMTFIKYVLKSKS